MNHHPLIDQFPPLEIQVPSGYTTDYLGNLTRAEHLQSPQPVEGGLKMTCLPAVDEEYFEWIDVLQSVVRADSSYTMLELGAGYGRWAARAHLAARRHGIKHIQLGLVEAEPAHVAWIPQHMQDNEIPTESFHVYDTALGAVGSANWFMIAMPAGSPNNSAKEWYGQSLMTGSHIAHEWVFGTSTDPRSLELENVITPEIRPHYRGRKFALLQDGWVAIRPQHTPLSAILRHYNHINLVDADIQGEEIHVFPEAIGELSARASCVHIGTHSKDCEQKLREIFSGAGWRSVWDFGCFQKINTTYGEVDFNDGVQTWLNPRFIA